MYGHVSETENWNTSALSAHIHHLAVGFKEIIAAGERAACIPKIHINSLFLYNTIAQGRTLAATFSEGHKFWGPGKFVIHP